MLRQAAQELHSDDVLLTFLDDLYLLTRRDRVRSAIGTVTANVFDVVVAAIPSGHNTHTISGRACARRIRSASRHSSGLSRRRRRHRSV